jgi:AraC-like DNA-binding protein
LPAQPCAVQISPALAEVLAHLSGARIGPSGVELRRLETGIERWLVSCERRHADAASVLLEQVKDAGVPALVSPFPGPAGADARLRPLLDSVRLNPADRRPLLGWASILRLSPATVNRLLRRETGLPFGAWRRQMRLLHAIEQLAQGQSVPHVAGSLGYRSAAKFTAMFERTVGSKPAGYFGSGHASRRDRA